MLQRKLTTKDNPFDPFDEPDRWNAFDVQKGYNTLALLDRVCITTEDATDEEFEKDWSKAIDDVMKYVDYGIYKVVERSVPS
jgi:hypothetical protein